MFEGYRIVGCVPSGRERTMSLLMKHLRANRDVLDGVQLWENVLPFDDHTVTAETDLDWIRSQADDFAVVIPLDPYEEVRVPKQRNTGRFYKNTVDPDTIYIRFDDDIIWIHPDAIRNLLTERLEHPEPLAVFPTIWNNAVISAIEQENGNIDQRYGPVHRYCMDDTGWNNPQFALYIHELLLDHIETETTEKLYVQSQELSKLSTRRRGETLPLRMSVSSFAWFGADMADHVDDLYQYEEEMYISNAYPNLTGNYNRLAGDALISHYSFFTQRPLLDENPHILGSYRQLAEDAYHDAYYRLLALEHAAPYRQKAWWLQ